MASEDIELYNVTDEGELIKVAITGQIKDMLNSEMVVLLVVDHQKMIYLWKGSNAKVRRKFIAARVSQDLRGQKGLNFKVDSIDQGDEPSGFIQVVGGPITATGPSPAAGPAPAMPGPAPAMPGPPPAAPPQYAPPPAPAAPPTPAIISQPVIAPPPTAPQAPTPGQSLVPDNIEPGVKAIINEIEKMPPPAPYYREIVFIGPYAFSIVETKKAMFGQEQIERKWELASPPEGQFLAQGYTPRAIIRSGKVLAVELLKGGDTGGAGASADTPIQIFKIKFQK